MRQGALASYSNYQTAHMRRRTQTAELTVNMIPEIFRQDRSQATSLMKHRHVQNIVRKSGERVASHQLYPESCPLRSSPDSASCRPLDLPDAGVQVNVYQA
jgi:hypothetical protein